MILTEEEDEDSLVEEGREIERGTVFLGETCHHEAHQRNIRDKRFPREACFDLGDVKVENVIVTFGGGGGWWRSRGGMTSMNAARCFSGTHATVRVTEEAVVTSGSCVECVLTWAMSKWRKTVGLSMKSRIKSLSWRKDLKLNDVEVKTLSWRKDLKLNAARCFSGTRATVRFSKETVVTSGSRVKSVLTRAISKLTKHIVTFNEEEDEDTLVEEVPQLNAARCFSGTHATVRFTRETFVTSGSHVKRVLPWAMSKWRKTVGLSM